MLYEEIFFCKKLLNKDNENNEREDILCEN